MKPRCVISLVWLALSGVLLAQPPRPGEPTSDLANFGANGATQAQAFQKPPPPKPLNAQPAATNGTAGPLNNPLQGRSLTGNLAAVGLPPLDANGANVTTTGANATANTPASPAAVPAAPAPEYNSVALPVTMDNIDSTEKLVPGDQFVLKIIEDRQDPFNLFVNERGNITVPWLNIQLPVAGHTLKEAAYEIQNLLLGKGPDGADPTSPDGKPVPPLDFYTKSPTVLAAYYHSDHSRGRIYVSGAVANADFQSIPQNKTLSFAEAIKTAGLLPNADTANIRIIRHDPESTIPVNLKEMLDKGIVPTDLLLQPDDFITVPSLAETGGSVMVSGKGVQHPIIIPLGGTPLMLSEAVARAETTDFSKLQSVRVERQTKDPKTGAITTNEQIVNVEEIYNGHNKQNDIPLQNGDSVVIDEKWLISPF